MTETSTDETRRCPRCAETIQAAAKVCRFCGAEFGAEGQAITPAAKARSGGGCGTIIVLVLLGALVAVWLLAQLGRSGAPSTPSAALHAAPSWLVCLDDVNDAIPAIDAEIRKRLAKPDTFRRDAVRVTEAPDASYVEAVVVFSAENAAGKRLEGTAFGRVSGGNCRVGLFKWVCLQPGFAPDEGQLFCSATGEADPT